MSFSADLTTPGDFYKFTVDIVNEGSIDAMIESIIKTPELTTDEKKYLRYEIEYVDGTSINDSQLLKSGETKTISILFSYRNDIAVSDLPTTESNFDLEIVLVYVQADSTGTEVSGDEKIVKVVSGDLNTVGSEICIGEECFYLMKNDGYTVTMLAKYNLYVGYNYTASATTVPIDNPTGLQNEIALGAIWDSEKNDLFPWVGTSHFSVSNYWSDEVIKYPAYVYNNNSSYYEYIEAYASYFKNTYFFDNNFLLVRVPRMEELIDLGCSETLNTCKSAPEWVYRTTYRTGSASDIDHIWYVSSGMYFGYSNYNSPFGAGVRPVIEIPLTEF